MIILLKETIKGCEIGPRCHRSITGTAAILFALVFLHFFSSRNLLSVVISSPSRANTSAFDFSIESLPVANNLFWSATFLPRYYCLTASVADGLKCITFLTFFLSSLFFFLRFAVPMSVNALVCNIVRLRVSLTAPNCDHFAPISLTFFGCNCQS